MKKIVILIGVMFSMIFFHDVVYASEIYYINENSVEFTQEEYDIISQFYWDGYQSIMTLEEYDEFLDLELLENGVETEYVNIITPYSTSVSGSGRTVKISKSCTTSYCNMSTTGTWNTIPATRSYDVIGARLSNVSRLTTPQTRVTTTTQSNHSSEMVSATNGFGVSILIPSTGTNIVVNQTFRVSKGGTVYASYQHATSSISLSDSKKYSISSSGYGGVLLFNNSVASKYDGMVGVSISV